MICVSKDDTKIYNHYCQFHVWRSPDDIMKFYRSFTKYSNVTKLKVLRKKKSLNPLTHIKQYVINSKDTSSKKVNSKHPVNVNIFNGCSQSSTR